MGEAGAEVGANAVEVGADVVTGAGAEAVLGEVEGVLTFPYLWCQAGFNTRNLTYVDTILIAIECEDPFSHPVLIS